MVNSFTSILPGPLTTVSALWSTRRLVDSQREPRMVPLTINTGECGVCGFGCDNGMAGPRVSVSRPDGSRQPLTSWRRKRLTALLLTRRRFGTSVPDRWRYGLLSTVTECPSNATISPVIERRSRWHSCSATISYEGAALSQRQHEMRPCPQCTIEPPLSLSSISWRRQPFVIILTLSSNHLAFGFPASCANSHTRVTTSHTCLRVIASFSM